MASKRKSIDLLNPINPPADLWTSIYTWVFKVGRYLLVGVEALLLVVFFSRFVMDEINNDLTKDINDKVELLSTNEFRAQDIKYSNIHAVLGDIKAIEKNQPINSEYIAVLTSAVPGSLNLERFAFNNGKVSMGIKTSNLKAVKDYEFSLRQNPNIKELLVTLSKNSSNSDTIDVSVSFTLVEEKK